MNHSTPHAFPQTPLRSGLQKSIRHVILPGTEADLLRRELARAFEAEGLRVTVAPPAELHGSSAAAPRALPGAPPPERPFDQPLAPSGGRRLEALLEDGPALVFSVNFQGLNPLKPVLERVERAGGLVAVWLVDNPWNILSGVRDPRWKGLPLFVTDEAFATPLAAHGASMVRHLPLAASFACFAPDERRDAAFPPPPDLAPFVFVGRSAFPGKEQFFAGQNLPSGSLAQALAMLEGGERPDLTWWEGRTGAAGQSLWPGKKARAAAFGAEEANLAWRAACVRAAAESGFRLAGGTHAGIDIFGDSGWRGLPDIAGKGAARLFPPVDYYARLPGIYRAARYSLCLTSLQLPAGLNQRHFDVWAAGGFALSDATPGLSLFPDELTRPVTFKRAGDIPAVAERLEARQDREALGAAWRNCLMQGHTYRHRVRTVLEALG